MQPIPNSQQLLKAKVHLGHLSRKWHPQMAPYIYKKQGNIHLINVKATQKGLDRALRFIDTLYANSPKRQDKILFVSTKKQAKRVLEKEAKSVGISYVSERWLGGFLTNFNTIRRSLKQLAAGKKMIKSKTFSNLAKREQLTLRREQAKQERILGGISKMTRLPQCVFIVDAKKEAVAVREANVLNIPIIAIVDTDTNPTGIDYPIPANDDSVESIELIVKTIAGHIENLKKQTAEKPVEEKEAKK